MGAEYEVGDADVASVFVSPPTEDQVGTPGTSEQTRGRKWPRKGTNLNNYAANQPAAPR